MKKRATSALFCADSGSNDLACEGAVYDFFIMMARYFNFVAAGDHA